jgi:hypothetical protein
MAIIKIVMFKLCESDIYLQNCWLSNLISLERLFCVYFDMSMLYCLAGKWSCNGVISMEGV